MASYFSTKEEALARIQELSSNYGNPAFFGKVRNNHFGTEQWLVDYDTRDYSSSFTILEDLTHDPALSEVISVKEIASFQKCLRCYKEYDARMYSCPHCGSTDGGLSTGYDALEIMIKKAESTKLNDQAAELFKKGLVEDAILLFRKAIEVNPMHEQAYSNLGALLMSQGDYAEAIRIFEQVLSFNPLREEAKSYLSIARSKLKFSPKTDNSSQQFGSMSYKKWWQFWRWKSPY